MIILSLQHVEKSFGSDAVLKDIHFSMNHRARLGVVGVNGCGKTTLLRLIAGQISPDEGRIEYKKDISIGYLEQKHSVKPGFSVLDEVESVFEEIFAMEEKMRRLEIQMNEGLDEDALQKVLQEYSRVQERFENANGYTIKSLALGVLQGLGFDKNQYDQKADTLSGGELTRLGLAKLLLQKPELLLLDEPTNHLDMQALQWLENYLINYDGAVMIVSHDRYFLDKVCSGVVELLFGVSEEYSGNYSRYLAQREERFLSRDRAYRAQQKEIARQKQIIARFKSFNREKSIKAAESREKALERMELLEKPDEEKQIFFRFTAKQRMGDLALRCEDLYKSFENKALFKQLSFEIHSGERIALIGPNGIGKSTLLEGILGKIPFDSGEVLYGVNAQLGYYDQKQQSLSEDKDVINEVWDAFPRLNQTQIRNALGLFQFKGDEVFMPVKLLSGGEKARVALAKLMLRQDNFLILDEPTNHLDADSRDTLEQALAGYEGTILAVSHDRYFINRIATKVMVLDADGISSYEGNFDAYQNAIAPPEDILIEDGEQRTKTEIEKEKRIQKAQKEELEKLHLFLREAEERAMAIESELNITTEKQGDPEIYTNPLKATEAARSVSQLKTQLAESLEQWERAEGRIRAFHEKNGCF